MYTENTEPLVAILCEFYWQVTRSFRILFRSHSFSTNCVRLGNQCSYLQVSFQRQLSTKLSGTLNTTPTSVKIREKIGSSRYSTFLSNFQWYISTNSSSYFLLKCLSLLVACHNKERHNIAWIDSLPRLFVEASHTMKYDLWRSVQLRTWSFTTSANECCLDVSWNRETTQGLSYLPYKLPLPKCAKDWIDTRVEPQTSYGKPKAKDKKHLCIFAAVQFEWFVNVLCGYQGNDQNKRR